MSFIPKNPLIMPEVESPSSTPPKGTRGIFAKQDGWYAINAYGDIEKLTTDTDRINSYKHYGSAGIIPSNPSLFTFDSSTGTIIGYSGGDTDIVIPYEIDGVSVTNIGDEAFYHCQGLRDVIIPNSVKNIGDGAFGQCYNLTKIEIPDSVTSISYEAFYYCTGLTSITIPDSVTHIGYGAFDSCTGLTSITIPDSVTSIEDYAFTGCTGLTSITIPDSVTSIGGGLFDYVPNVTVTCGADSYAETYCKDNNINYVLDADDMIKLLFRKLSTKTIWIELPSSDWEGDGLKYYQTIQNDDEIFTRYSKVDLQPTVEQLIIFHEKDISFVTENDNGTIKVYCIGQKPVNNYTIQATIKEVEING